MTTLEVQMSALLEDLPLLTATVHSLTAIVNSSVAPVHSDCRRSGHRKFTDVRAESSPHAQNHTEGELVKNGLTLYPQHVQHDEVFIVGTREGLRALRDALDVALSANGIGITPHVFNSDGEGYKVYVAALSEHHMDGISTPYASDSAQDSPDVTRMLPTSLPHIREALEAEG